MRFDFHPTRDGWRISEVNSDVPGGFTEATNLASLMARHVPGARLTGDPTRALVEALAGAVGDHGSVALTHAPGHMEDHQVVAHLAAALRQRGLTASATSLGQLAWKDGRAQVRAQVCAQVGAQVGDRPVDAIFRFYQAEWLARLPRSLPWERLFVDGRTPVVNPLSALLSESKRVPLVWDRLGIALPTWRRLLPETRALAEAPWQRDDSWLIKSAYSNTGDDVCVRAALPARQWRRRSWAARLNPGLWLAQRRFAVTPVSSADGPLHPCIGVYVVDGKAAGAYARVTPGAVIDYRARDAAVLVVDEP
jgi:glutathionylspermidine synthase